MTTELATPAPDTLEFSVGALIGFLVGITFGLAVRSHRPAAHRADRRKRRPAFRGWR